MDEEPNPIRDIVYQKLEQLTEKTIQEQFLQGNGAKIITEITNDCWNAVMELQGEKDEKIAKFATTLLHYLFTNLLIPTQRKTTLDEVEIDVVIPDTKTLKLNWNSSLLLCILSSVEKNHIEQRISEAKKIQPNQENIWIVSPNSIETDYRTFVVKQENGFSDIIDQINKFLEKSKSAKFRIFKAV